MQADRDEAGIEGREVAGNIDEKIKKRRWIRNTARCSRIRTRRSLFPKFSEARNFRKKSTLDLCLTFCDSFPGALPELRIQPCSVTSRS
jgi:hypothetical protein